MRTPRAIALTATVVAVAFLAALAAAYLAAKRVPDDYRPLTPTALHTAEAVDSLRNTVIDFVSITSRIGSRDPDADAPLEPQRRQFVVSQNDMNRWIAALPPEALASLRQSGLSRPAIAIGEDRLTFYAHLETINAVVGLDFSLDFDEDQTVAIKMESVRLGGFRLPDRLVEANRGEALRQIRQRLFELASTDADTFGPVPVADIGEAGSLLVEALDGRRIRLDVPKKYGHVRVSDVRLSKGKMTLDIVSLLGAKADS